MPGDAAFAPSGRWANTPGSSRMSGSTSLSISSVTAPGRRMAGGSVQRVRTVDSTPIVQLPPSMIASTRPVRSWIQCPAQVGLGQRCPGASVQLPRDRVGRHPQRDRLQPARRLVRHPRGLLKDHRHRAGPEPFCQCKISIRQAFDQRARLFGVRDMYNQRVVARAPFGRIDRRCCRRVERIRRQPIDCLGRDHDQTARTQQRSGPVERRCILFDVKNPVYACLQSSIPPPGQASCEACNFSA